MLTGVDWVIVMIISGLHPMKEKKYNHIYNWIQELSKSRPELGNFAVCPYASKANFIILDEELRNGQFCLYPNNRCRIFDTSMTPQDVKIPDFKVSTRIFEVENDVNWGRLGDCDDYFWTTPDERREE